MFLGIVQWKIFSSKLLFLNFVIDQKWTSTTHGVRVA